MQKIDSLIHAKWVLPIAPSQRILHQHSIAIHDGKIIDCLPTSECHQQFNASNEVIKDQHILMPGLINNHAHSPMNLFRGLANDLPLMQWLNHHIWPAEKQVINPRTVEFGSTLAIAEMIRGGTTCFNDNYAFPLSTRTAAINAGIRASLGLLIFNIECQWSNNETEGLDKAQAILAEHNQSHHLITWTLTPHSPYTVSNQAFIRLKEIAEQYQLPVHLHLHETHAEIEMSLEQYQMRPIQRLFQLGLIDQHLMAIHMVHINPQEISLLAEKKSHVIHCPESNLKLGSGISPIKSIREAGINISLGTDGAASNNDLDLFSEMRTAALVCKGSEQDPTILPAHEMLAMATINAAKALGLDHKIGSIEPGKQADLIAIDTSDYWQQPVYDPIAHLVYASNPLAVSDSWVAGKPLMENKVLTTIDTAALSSKLKPLMEEIKPFMYQSEI